MRVVILHDQVPAGASPDQIDVLVQAETVSRALKELGYDPVILGLSLDFKMVIEELKGLRPLFVFNLVESIEGCGRLIHLAPAILDYLGIPYTGSKTDAVYLTSNKLIAKNLLKGAGIPTPQGFQAEEVEGATRLAPGLYIIKSLWEHASIGLDEDSVLFAERPDTLRSEMRNRRQNLGGDCYAELYIEGREFNLAVLASKQGPDVLPPAEIRFEDFPEGKRRIVGYRAKWDEDSFEYRHTVRIFQFPPEDQHLLQQLAEIARRCWFLFDLRGYARVDFRVDERGKPWVLEINANPCLSPDAGFLAAAVRQGLSYADIIERIIEDSVTAHEEMRGTSG